MLLYNRLWGREVTGPLDPTHWRRFADRLIEVGSVDEYDEDKS
jgi:hypothetical protein